MTRYVGSVNGQKVNLTVDFKYEPLPINDEGNVIAPKVHIRQLSVDDLELIPVSTDTVPMLQTMRAAPAPWVSRGDTESFMRCFIATKGGEPAGYFNVGVSAVKVNYNDFEFMPNECGGLYYNMDLNDYAKVIYAATCYYDLVHIANPNCFSSHVIYTTKDEKMTEALIAGGWAQPAVGDSFFDALTSISEEVADGRGPRFSSQDGKFVERCIVKDDSVDGWHYEFEAKNVLVHEIGANLHTLHPAVEDEVPVVDVSGAAEDTASDLG